jgi:hypothetical protein
MTARFSNQRSMRGHRQRLQLVVDVFGFDFQLLFAGFANPVVFAVDKGVVVDALAVVFGAEITLHDRILSYLGFLFLGRGAEYNQINSTICGATLLRAIRSDGTVLAVSNRGEPLGRDVSI